MKVRIRPEAEADRDAIATVTRAAFGREQEARMVDAIRASDGFVPELSLVARADVVGHVLPGWRCPCAPATLRSAAEPSFRPPTASSRRWAPP